MNLNDYDRVVINTSGGKDSQTMLRYVVGLAAAQDYPVAHITAVHADLGVVEWEGTAALAARQVATYPGIRFVKVSRERGDLLDQVRARGMWPSSTNRYCTSDQKRDQIAKVITALQRSPSGRRMGSQSQPFTILSCMGLRAQESPARAKKQPLAVNRRLSTLTRTVTDWLPILGWTEDQVWTSIRASGVEHHRAYDLGMPRLSCVLCIFAPRKALVLAGKHNRPLLDRYAALEAEIGHRFRVDCSIADVQAAVIADETTDDLAGDWNM